MISPIWHIISIFEHRVKVMEKLFINDQLTRLKVTLGTTLVSIWGYFENIQNLITAILIALSVNLLLRFILVLKKCNIRKMQRHPFDINHCIGEIGFKGILSEAFMCTGCLCFLVVIQKQFSADTEISDIIDFFIKWATYFALLVYCAIVIVRFGYVFSDTVIVRVFSIFFKKVNIFKNTPLEKVMEDEESKKEIEDIINEKGRDIHSS